MWRNSEDALSFEFDGSFPGLEQASDGIEGGRFSCTVCADESNYLALTYLKGNSLYRMYAPVVNVQIFNFQNSIHIINLCEFRDMLQ